MQKLKESLMWLKLGSCDFVLVIEGFLVQKHLFVLSIPKCSISNINSYIGPSILKNKSRLSPWYSWINLDFESEPLDHIGIDEDVR